MAEAFANFPSADLTVIDPAGHRTVVDLRPLPFRIGRQADNQLVIRDSRTSRVHAQIFLEDREYILEDLASRHGLFVNGKRVTRHRLCAADRIEFGVPDSFQVVFGREGDAPASQEVTLAPSPRMTLPEDGGDLSKLRAVLDVARAVQNSFSLEDVLATVVGAALTITGAERGFLLLRKGATLEVRCARDASGATLREEDLRVPLSLIHRSLQKRRELLSMVFDPADLEPGESAAELELRSAVCMPLLKIQNNDMSATSVLSTANDTAGVLYLDSRTLRRDMAAGNRELLQTLALEASTILENARLLQQERHKHKIEQELDVARDIQQSLLPAALPATGWFRAAGSSVATHQVGGDYFDVLRTGPEAWAAVVADVAGKGVSSALLASLLQGAFLTLSDHPEALAATMSRINEILYERTEGGKFATVFAALCDSTGRFSYINAGHCAPIVVRRGETLEYLEPTVMPVGLVAETGFALHQADLTTGAKVVIYSDGVTEAENQEGAFFGKRRLRDVIMKHAEGSCVELHRAIVEAVRDFTGDQPQSDDVTLLVIEIVPK
ncbi:MAG TPA: hypothetical protein DEQ47_04070 [Solibacterales bacterium]|nr:hypothetical protein [Bryobacterales bacterium]